MMLNRILSVSVIPHSIELYSSPLHRITHFQKEATRHRSTGSAFRWAITGSAEHLMNHLENQVKDLGLEFVCHADENLGVETNAGYVQGTTDKGVRRLRQGDA